MQYFEPNFLDEALVLLERFGSGARVLAGGTLLGPQLRPSARSDETLVNVKRIDELSVISVAGRVLRIGALATAAQLAQNDLVIRHAPLVAQAAATIGARQLRNVATLGGNLCSGHPAADLSAALLASAATCEISSIRDGPTTLPIDRLFRDGSHGLSPGELLVAVTVEIEPSPIGIAYQKMTTRRAFEMALVAVAAWVKLDANIVAQARIALGGAAPRPVRAFAAETVLSGQPLDPQSTRNAATVAAQADADPADDSRASAEYRRHLVAVLTERALSGLQRTDSARGNE